MIVSAGGCDAVVGFDVARDVERDRRRLASSSSFVGEKPAVEGDDQVADLDHRRFGGAGDAADHQGQRRSQSEGPNQRLRILLQFTPFAARSSEPGH